MSDGATTAKNKLYIGLAKWLGTAALIVYGGVQIAGPADVIERTTIVDRQTGQQVTAAFQTGAVIKVNGITHHFIDTIPLTMSGGAANYDLTWICPDDYGISGSGITLNAGISMVRNPANAKFDIVYMKTKSTASGSSPLVLSSLDNLTVASGSLVLRGTASGSEVNNGSYSRWNSADCIAVKTLTNPTSSGSGYLILEGMDDLSE